MELTDDEIYKKFLKDYEIEDEIDKEYYRNSTIFASYLLRYRVHEFAETLDKNLLSAKKALEKISRAFNKKG